MYMVVLFSKQHFMATSMIVYMWPEPVPVALMQQCVPLDSAQPILLQQQPALNAFFVAWCKLDAKLGHWQAAPARPNDGHWSVSSPPLPQAPVPKMQRSGRVLVEEHAASLEPPSPCHAHRRQPAGLDVQRCPWRRSAHCWLLHSHLWLSSVAAPDATMASLACCTHGVTTQAQAAAAARSGRQACN